MKSHSLRKRSRLPNWVGRSASILIIYHALRLVPSASAAMVLTNTAQIRSLPRSEVELTPPVKLQGMATFSFVQWQLLFLQDEWGGCYVYPSTIHTNIPTGRWLEVEGSVGKGVHGPIILESAVTVLEQPPRGRGLPSPRPTHLRELALGRDDAQWVAVTGVVRRISLRTPGWNLVLATPTAHILVHVTDAAGVVLPTEWVNTRIHVRGVCIVTLGQNQYRQVDLYCSSSSDITPDRSAPPPSFQEPSQPLDTLTRLVQASEGEHRVRVEGQVTHVATDGVVYVADAQAGLCIRGSGFGGLAPGDGVEASGFISFLNDELSLAEAQLRKVRSGAPPMPGAIPDSSKLSTNDLARLLTLKCRVLQSESGPSSDRLTLTRLATGEGLVAEVPAAAHGEPPAFYESGSILELTGIWTARSDRGLSGTLLCRNPRDVTLLRRPSWWTARRIATVIGSGAATTLVAVLWAVSLRRQVRTQTEQIRLQLQHEVALERRYQELFANANDALLVLDATGGIIELNPAAEQILQRSRQELLGKPFRDRLAPSCRQKLQDRIERSASQATDEALELELAGPDAQPRILEVTSCRCRSDTGSLQVQLIAHDITARKQSEAQLANLNLELYQTSRQAGMAEVATAVLHNVGNVLNSVNVSATLIGHRLGKLHVAEKLTKAAQLMETHTSEPARFLRDDARVRELPSYLKMLAQHVSAEHDQLQEEARHLANNVDHIKEIVAMQQSYAKVSGVLEPVTLADLVEKAWRIHAEALARHRIEFVREFEPVPVVMLDKHKAMQILVNVLHNAKQACADGGPEIKRVTVRIRPGIDETVVVEAEDNGIGIAPENLTGIFSRGFTTRKGGHGFGLHNAALAAKEMGGSLSAHSDGLGAGATFVLQLPLRPARVGEDAGGSAP